MSQYSVYKKTGVSWIPEIPSTWRMARLKTCARQITERADSNGGYIGLENVESWTGKYTGKKKNEAFEAESASIAVRRGNVLFGKLRPYLAKCYIAESDGCCSTEFIVMDPISINSAFLKYLILSPSFIDSINMSTYGSKMPRANWDFIGNMPIPIPSTEEQLAIASYLNQKIEEIDFIISEAQGSIDEYKQWRASLIYEAVTKGLDSSAEMIASGEEWIGMIPKGTKMSRVGMHHEITLGKMLCPDSLGPEYTLEPYYCAANVHFDGISGELKKMWFNPAEKENYLIKQGDLLVVEGGAGAGGCAIAKEQPTPVYIQNSILRVVPKHDQDIRYLRYLIECLVKKGYVDFVCNKATIPHFTKEKLASVPYPVFKGDIQSLIADYLDEKCSSIDALIREKEALIADLEDYKKSLIFEVVTGKRKVV